MKLLLTLLSLTIISCSSGGGRKGFVDPQLKPYVAMLKVEAAKRDLTIDDSRLYFYLGKTSAPRFFAEEQGGAVMFNETKFETMPEDLRLLVTFHEAGHALYNYKHSLDPKSIMARGGLNTGSLKISEVTRIDKFFFPNGIPITPTK